MNKEIPVVTSDRRITSGVCRANRYGERAELADQIEPCQSASIEHFGSMLGSCFFSYSIDCSATVSVRWINFVIIDMIRWRLFFPIHVVYATIASNDWSTLQTVALSNAGPRAISKNRFLSLRLCFPFSSEIFRGIDCVVRNHGSRACRSTPVEGFCGAIGR